MVSIELAIAAFLVVAGAAVRLTTALAVAAPLLIAGIAVVASVPVTLGALWDDQRTSARTKAFAILMLFSEPVGEAAGIISGRSTPSAAITNLMVWLEMIGAVLFLFFTARGIGRKLGGRAN